MLEGAIGGILRKQTTLAKMAKKKNISALERQVNEHLAKIKVVGATLIREKLMCVHEPQYLEEKQNLLNQIAQDNGTKPKKAKIEEYEYLMIMNETELQVALLALLPVIKLEEKPPADKCKYLIGSQAGVLMIKAN